MTPPRWHGEVLETDCDGFVARLTDPDRGRAPLKVRFRVEALGSGDLRGLSVGDRFLWTRRSIELLEDVVLADDDLARAMQSARPIVPLRRRRRWNRW